MTPIDWKLVQRLVVFASVVLNGRQSLVTPIDWKPVKPPEAEDIGLGGRQSLVTPIDWKPRRIMQRSVSVISLCRQSLVTPIDWKPER